MAQSSRIDEVALVDGRGNDASMAHAKWLAASVGFVAMVSVAACGSEVTDGRTGANGATGATTVSSSSTGGSISCINSEECGPDAFCDFPDGICPGEGTLGKCAAAPNGCDDSCPGFCGCDSRSYCNSCEAQRAGVDGPGTECGSPAEYRAMFRSGAVDRVNIRVFHFEDSSCATYQLLNVGDSSPPQPNLDVSAPWALESIGLRVNSDYESCIVNDGPPSGMPVESTSITGTIELKQANPSSDIPCFVVLDTEAIFGVNGPYAHFGSSASVFIEDGFCPGD